MLQTSWDQQKDKTHPGCQGVLTFQVNLYDKTSFVCGCVHLQVSLFSSVLINRFHCIRYMNYHLTRFHSSYMLVFSKSMHMVFKILHIIITSL